MTFGAVAADLRSLQSAQGLPSLMAWLIAFLFVTFLSLDHDRYRSWERLPSGKPSKVKHLWFGVIIPDVAAMIMFGAYQWAKVFP